MAGGLKAAAASADENNLINITFNNLDDGDGLGRDSPHGPTSTDGPTVGLGWRGRRQGYSNFIKATAAEETGLAKASAEFDNFCAGRLSLCGFGLNSLKSGPKGDLNSDAA